MQARLSDSWWFARVVAHPAPADLVLQLRVTIALYFLMVCIPSLTDLILNEGSYNVLYGSYVVPSICTSAGFLLLIWFLVRAADGAWRLFWNSRFLPNVICMILAPAVLWLSQWAIGLAMTALIKSSPGLEPYRWVDPSVHPKDFPANLMLPMVFFTIVSQATVTQAFVMTRIRQCGGGLFQAVLWSALLYSASNFGWGIDAFVSALISGVLFAVIFARWGGLVGLILGRMAWEASNYIKL